VRLLGFKIFSGELNDVFSQKRRQCIINTLNPHSYIKSMSDPVFYEALSASDVLLPDGSGILFASKILNGKSINKITGPEAMDFALSYLNRAGGKVYFLGSSEKILSSIKIRMTEAYSNIDVLTFSPPFSDEFTDSENRKILDSVTEFNPDLLCVAMTAPKQEKWVYINKGQLPACCIMSIGAAIDWFSGVKKQPSKFSRRFHLAWFERFAREPIRMMPRIKSMIFFIYIVLRIKIKKILK
jgi:N-acetylglucosaminyldiphosphoundecaprenol N-acetyl-beta-D-mannosaminyltransferase